MAWVREVCRTHLVAVKADEGGGGEVEQGDVDMLAGTIISQVHRDISDDELQGDLLQLLGFGAIDLIGAVFPQRAAVNTAVRRLLAAIEAAARRAVELGGAFAVGRAHGRGKF